MGIFDDYKQAIKEEEALNNGVAEENIDKDVQEQMNKMLRQMDEYDKNGTIDGVAIEIKKVEGDDYEGIDIACERNMDDNSDNLIDSIDPMARFRQEYRHFSEEDLTVIKSSKDYEPVLIQAYCPKCGKPIISKTPTMFNPYTMQNISKYDCECGWKAMLDYSYPRLVMRNKNTGEEIGVYVN